MHLHNLKLGSNISKALQIYAETSKVGGAGGIVTHLKNEETKV